MTNERKHPDSVGDGDSLVSRTYRERVDERTPARLNKAVLRQAAAAVQPSYSRSMRWMRPVAWAATIAICLAITLQYTQLPAPDSVAPGIVFTPEIVPTTAGEPPDMPAETRDVDSIPSSPNPAAAATTVGRSSDAEASLKDKVEPKQASPVLAPGAAVPETRQRTFEATRDLAVPEESSASSAADFETQDTQILKHAEELARMQSGNNRESEQPTRSAYAMSEVASSSDTQSCDDEEKATPATWTVCIDRLAEAGLTDEADRQRQLLAEAFPNFEAP